MFARDVTNLRGVTSFTSADVSFGTIIMDMGITVVGLSHDGRADICRQNLIPGLVVFLEREPGNVHDQNAVKVVLGDGITIGYIPRDLARYLSADLDDGLRYTCHVSALSNLDIDYILPEVIINIARSAT